MNFDADSKKLVGAHVSSAGGVENAPLNAAAIGAEAFALFLKNQRRWSADPLAEESIRAFTENCDRKGFSKRAILPHDGYLVNLGNPDREGLIKSRGAFLDEMKRCEQLGLVLLNFHPGSHRKLVGEEACMDTIADSINMTLEKTGGVTAVIENTAGQGGYLGSTFEQLAYLIDKIEDKTRAGVCLDTCHLFAAGYDIRTGEGFNAVMDVFDRTVGFDYLRGMHLNDSKGKLGSHLDRHDSLGEGELGMEPFRFIMRDPRFNGIPLILETIDPSRWPREIVLLHALEAGE